MFKLAFSPAAKADLRPAPALPVWVRWAVWLSFVAVLCLLLAPASLLAQDLKSGKLGGVCTVAKGAQGDAQHGDADEALAHSHCPLCSASWGLPQAGASLPLVAAAAQTVAAVAPADPAARVTGLPFSRAPPAL